MSVVVSGMTAVKDGTRTFEKSLDAQVCVSRGQSRVTESSLWLI